MDGYEQFCPVAKAAEIVTRRWTPLLIRELLCGSHRFNELRRGLPRMSPSLLSRRLSELEEAGVIERRGAPDGDPQGHAEYHLTEAGEALRPIVVELGFWGQRWVRTKVEREDLDAGLLMWDLQRRVPRESLPDERVVVRFTFVDAPEEHERFWLVLEPGSVDLCLKDPGYGWDVAVTTNVRTLTEVWLGDRSLASATRSDALRVSGPRSLRRRVPEWIGLSLFAE